MNEPTIPNDAQLFEALSERLQRHNVDDAVSTEAEWTAVFERLANRYFADDTQALIALLAFAQDVPLETAVARQTRLYFQGVTLFKQDEYDAAILSFDELLDEKDLPLPLHARALNSRSVLYRINGRLQAAMDGYQASLVLWQQLGNGHYQGIVHLNLGIIHYGLRHYAEAETHLRQAEQFFAEAGSHAWLVSVQNELGLVQRDLGNWDAALACFDRVIAQRREDGVWEDVGMGLANRAEILLFKGEFAQAKAALQETLTLMVSRTYRIDHLLYLGLAHHAEGDLTEAEQCYREALALAEQLDRRENLPHVLAHLANLLQHQGDDGAALALLVQAAELIEASRTPLEDEALKISLLGRWQQIFEALVLHCLALGRVEEAFDWAERARARAFAELLDDENEWLSLTAVQRQIPADTTILVYFTTGVLEQDMPLLKAIAPDNPLRPLVLMPGKTVRFTLAHDQISVQECPLNPNLFATSSPRGFDATRFLKTAVLQRLHQDLLGGVGLPSSLNHLVIVPHGPLHRVPFAALSHDLPPVSYAPSVAIWMQQRQRQSTSLSGGLAVGYSGEWNGRYLPYTEREVAQIARLMGGEAWTDEAPKKERLRQQARSCRWLHLACHGWFDDADPLASYLETGKGERLTAREVLETWQLQAELVVLSACQTGVSQILRGDEPMGLIRAFLHTGARAVMVSQWLVDDLTTCLLMCRFYELLQDGVMGDAALAQAQYWLRIATISELQQARQKWSLDDLPILWDALPETAVPYADPVYWAGFVWVGCPSEKFDSTVE